MSFGRAPRSPLSNLGSPEEVEAEIRRRIPVGTRTDEVPGLTRRLGLECSTVVEDRMTCSVTAKSGLALVRAKWLIVLLFRNGLVADVEVEKGLIGP